MADERRYRIFYVTPELMMGCLAFRATAERRLVGCHTTGLPDGYKLLAVQYDFGRDAFGFKVEHPSFDVVPDGDLIPEMQVTCWAVYEPEPASLPAATPCPAVEYGPSPLGRWMPETFQPGKFIGTFMGRPMIEMAEFAALPAVAEMDRRMSTAVAGEVDRVIRASLVPGVAGQLIAGEPAPAAPPPAEKPRRRGREFL